MKYREKGEKGISKEDLKNKEILRIMRLKDEPCYLPN
jgi:hypothetical protein